MKGRHLRERLFEKWNLALKATALILLGCILLFSGKHSSAKEPVISTPLAQLGRELFFDKRLSRDRSISCSNCHDPAMGFADHNTVAVGANSLVGLRNAPTIVNLVFNSSFFGDGRSDSLEEQVKQPLISHSEMGMPSLDAVAARIKSIPDYRLKFRRVFGKGGITIDRIVMAIAAYERTLLSMNSPFDRFLSGDILALSKPQQLGWELFRGKARCINCHKAQPLFPLFTNQGFHNTGIATKKLDLDELADCILRKVKAGASLREVDPNILAHTAGYCELGRFNVTRDRKDIGAFKTPSLRDVELTAPYMHNGSLKTLIDVVRFYNKGGETNPYLDTDMKPLDLDEREMNNLVEFLRALTSDDILRLAQESKPQTRTTVPITPGTSRKMDK